MSTVQEKLRAQTKPAPKPEVAEAPQSEPVPAVEGDPWAFVAMTSVVVPAFVRGPSVDVERDIHPTLRAVFEVSLAEYAKEIDAADGSKLPANTPKFREFNAGSLDKADEFVGLARKFAKYRRVEGAPDDGQVSVRVFAKKHDDGGKSSTVRFAFMPLVKNESKRAPGSAGNGDAALVRDWAKRNGIDVPERGRIPQELRDKYNAAKAAEVATSEAPAA